MHYEKFADGTVKCIEDEIPFELPKSWSWCRVGNIFAHNTGKALNSSDSNGTKLTYITTSNLYWDRFELENLKEMPFTDTELEKCTVRKGDLLVCEGGDIGRAAIWQKDEEIRIQNHIHKLRPFIELSNRFFYYVLFLWKRMERIGGRGIGLQGFSSKALHNLLVPLPPINEQLEIVNKLDYISSYLESIEELNDDMHLAISSVKSKILDLAIQGKLVPQDPTDEPASVLLERIRAEKEELIKQGKIKRDKKESIIFKGDDNSYYENLPENWCVSCLADITNSSLLNDGDWILSENMDSNGTVKLIQLGSIGFMNYINKGFKFITDDTFMDLSCTQIYPSYLLINRIINDRMCLCILPNIAGKLITTVDTCWIAPNSDYDIKYLMYVMASPQFQSLVIKHSTGVTRKRISKNNLIKLPFPFPPLNEQKRIVSHVDVLLEIIYSIEKSLN